MKYLLSRQREAKDEGREDDKVLRLSPAQLYSICREASKTVRDGDITPLIDVTIPDLAGEIMVLLASVPFYVVFVIFVKKSTQIY